MAEYMDRSLNPETPHPYAIAEVMLDMLAIIPAIVFLADLACRPVMPLTEDPRGKPTRSPNVTL